MKGAPLDQSRLLGLVGYHCRRAYLRVFVLWGERMARIKVRPAEYSILVLVAANPGVNQKWLAKALAIEPPNLATLLDRMESAGWLLRRRNPEDKRSQLLDLTPLGRRRCDQAVTEVERVESDAMAALSPGERAELMRLLRKIFLE
jgi:DNA-binding MarR family transcriptional regulator